jgi:hypothetical protein
MMQTIEAVPSYESEVSTSSGTSRGSTEDREAAIPDTIPFRRVQSDIVGSTPTISRQYQQQHQVTCIGINTTSTSHLRLVAKGASSSTNAATHDNQDNILSTTPLTANDNSKDDDDDDDDLYTSPIRTGDQDVVQAEMVEKS